MIMVCPCVSCVSANAEGWLPLLANIPKLLASTSNGPVPMLFLLFTRMTQPEAALLVVETDWMMPVDIAVSEERNRSPARADFSGLVEILVRFTAEAKVPWPTVNRPRANTPTELP